MKTKGQESQSGQGLTNVFEEILTQFFNLHTNRAQL